MIPVRWAVPYLFGIPKVLRDKRILLMLRGFFDESGKSGEETHLILAGWTASVEEWERFIEAWWAALQASPRISYFKFSEANGLSGEFREFNQNSVDAKKTLLAGVIRNHNLRGYYAPLAHSVLSDKPPIFRKMMSTTLYDWCFMALVRNILRDRLDRGEHSGESISYSINAAS